MSAEGIALPIDRSMRRNKETRKRHDVTSAAPPANLNLATSSGETNHVHLDTVSRVARADPSGQSERKWYANISMTSTIAVRKGRVYVYVEQGRRRRRRRMRGEGASDRARAGIEGLE